MQWQVTTVHDRVSSQRGLVTAISALEAAVAVDSIAMPVATNGAHKAVRPLDFVEIFETGFLVGKTLDKLTKTQSFFLRHNWHHLYDAIIYKNSSVISD